jgi:glycosyltransferase involved in cell wall biosynthesis
VIGYVGRLCEQKAPERLIEACLRLMPEMPDLHLLMVGDGPQRAVLQQRLENVGLGSRVTWLGEVEATQFMPAMDMFTLPSRYEGFAYVLIEALQAGLPIVATPVGGARESVLPGGNGFIVPHDSIDAMADALGRLARDGRLRQAMAQASRVHATYFSVTRMVDDIEALYHHRLGARNAVGSARRNRARDTHPQLSDA